MEGSSDAARRSPRASTTAATKATANLLEQRTACSEVGPRHVHCAIDWGDWGEWAPCFACHTMDWGEWALCFRYRIVEWGGGVVCVLMGHSLSLSLL
eukprot:COSAG02_NODE_1752_length_11064_cov_16.303785_5_plen_97_part_00